MDIKELLRLKTRLSSLTVFRQLLSDGVIDSLIGFLDSLNRQDTASSVSAYAEFVSRLYDANSGNLSEYIKELCDNCENVYVKLLGCGATPPEHISESVSAELAVLQQVADLTADKMTDHLDWDGFLPGFKSEKADLAASYAHRTVNIGKYGYGKYARNRMFCVDENGNIIAVKNPDTITLDSLVDYESERKIIIENTKALLSGKPAANILLTGDAGTGKSSTVKAIVNEFYSEGLRIIEIRKDQLRTIPKILDELALNPLKFILFIDDLSFLSDDDNFNALKAVLEGSVSARSHNVVVYATSNRRHIVREKFSDREGDDIHRNDTMQEIVSLSNRFGIHITFQKPDKQTYLDIVRNLAVKNGLTVPAEEMEKKAEQFALERGGRSARLAKQFIDRLLSEQK